MSLKAKDYKGGKVLPVLEIDTYPARLVQVIGVGTHEQFDWQTKESQGKKPRVMLTFELPTETAEFDGEEKPRWISREYTISFNEMSTMFKIINAIDPKDECDGDLAEMLGLPCTITIAHTKTGKAKIASVNALSKGMAVDELFNDTRSFDMDSPDMEVFKTLPDWIKDKVRTADEFVEGSAIKTAVDLFESELDEDIPF